MKNYVFTLCVLLALLSCTENENPVNSPETLGYQINGEVYDKYRNGVYSECCAYNIIENAIIEIDGRVDTTNRNGKFHIGGVPQKEHRVKIAHPYYELYLDRINVSSDTTINFKMTPIFGDYFPLEIGTEWQYDFNKCLKSGVPFVTNICVKTWKVVNKENVTNTIKYTIEEISSDQIEINHQAPRQDTLFFQDDTTYFSIFENSNGILTCDEKREFQYIQIPRYYPLRNGDTFVFSPKYNYDIEYVLEKDTGLSKYFRRLGTTMNNTVYNYSQK